MSLRTKLTLMFFGALQVTFLTAVAAFWGVQSWQLLTDDLTLIQEQNLRLERALEDVQSAPTAKVSAPSPHDRATPRLRALRRHAQTFEEVTLVDALISAAAGTRVAEARADTSSRPAGVGPALDLREAARRLKGHYRRQARQLRARARVVTQFSSMLFVGIVAAVLTAMMAYFAAIRLWFVRPIKALGRATAAISTGDLSHRIQLAGHDELGALAASINTMAASLAEIQQRLVAAERFAMVGEMSAYIAHNIRNPLASIRATAQSELCDLAEGDPRRASFADIITAADRLESWVGDLLRFSGPVTLARGPESVNTLLARCAELTRPQLGRKGLDLRLDLDPALPAVILDRNKMEQVFSTVLANAIDASPAGSTIRIASTLRPGPNGTAHACIRTEDAGAGIPSERLTNLFTLFFTTKATGTGLGLAMAHKIVTAHGGTIAIASREGEGTVVEIRLPTAEGSGNGVGDSHR
jgi:signal transduction histidine kinase